MALLRYLLAIKIDVWYERRYFLLKKGAEDSRNIDIMCLFDY
jgi:hypothetical protein